MKIAALSFSLVALGAGLSGALFLASELIVAAWKIGAFYGINALNSKKCAASRYVSGNATRQL